MHCCLWFRSVFRVRGPWPKRYGYHLSIIYLMKEHNVSLYRPITELMVYSVTESHDILHIPYYH